MKGPTRMFAFSVYARCSCWAGLIACFLLSPSLLRSQDRQDTRKLQDGKMELIENEDTVVIRQSGRLVLTYNKTAPLAPEDLNKIYARTGFLHPVASPQEHVATAMYPADHAHQHGIFSAWVQTTWDGREIDFWNLAEGTGRVLHERIVSTFANDGRVGFESDLLHRATRSPVVDVLRERWRVVVGSTDGTFHQFDLETSQEALTDKPLVVKEYHYGGVAFRGSMQWLSANDSFAKANASKLNLSSCEIKNDLGSDRNSGNHERARWVSIHGKIDGSDVTVCMLSHRSNFRASQPARLHPTKPYFVFSPCVLGEFQIDREHPFRSKYRFLVTDAPPRPEWIQSMWDEWHAE